MTTNHTDSADELARAAEKIAPVQGYTPGIPWSLHLEAYDAYCKKWGPQPALIDLEGRNCRGGFGTSELDEFIPGWRDKVSEIGKLRARVAALESELTAYRTRPAPETAGEAVSSIDHAQRVGHLGSPEDWREACRRYRIRCSDGDIASMARLHAYIEDGLLAVVRPVAPAPAQPLTVEQIDKALNAYIPGGSSARDWFLPHDTEKGKANVRDVVQRMFAAAQGVKLKDAP